MAQLFEPAEINSMTLANRFVRSATYEGLAAEDGAVAPALVKMMKDLAEGGVGLIISSHAYVSPAGQAGPGQLGAYKDGLVPGLADMAGVVHNAGGRIVLQLAHAGYHASTRDTGRSPVSPSDLGISKTPRHALDTEEIAELAEDFARAARRAKTAGFDGVQIHAAHGYLLSQFLSPYYNRRKDAYGGPIVNRARAAVEVTQAVRRAVGDAYPVLVKMNCRDFHDSGLELEDSLQAAQMLAENGIDAIELSGGLLINKRLTPSRTGVRSEKDEAYHETEAKAFKEKINVPLILVGGIRSYPVARRLVDQGTADYISMARPFIREPGLVKRWQSENRDRAACISDNQCFQGIQSGLGVYCVTAEKAG
ncbi:MAG: NADH:flavin oxidoreductase [Desulfobacterales bacterium]|nr:NADH:flavin oxidoreductase [Desulfobacterales bacterium]MBS3756902.1 NADH:flavin oxidoreductase [Desulfobacterales bacterium]